MPIVKYVDSESGCQVDICFNQTNGPQNSAVIKGYLSDYWELKPLVLVLKYFLLQRDLNETYTGGLGSYALVLLVISFLQVCAASSIFAYLISTTDRQSLHRPIWACYCLISSVYTEKSSIIFIPVYLAAMAVVIFPRTRKGG